MSMKWPGNQLVSDSARYRVLPLVFGILVAAGCSDTPAADTSGGAAPEYDGLSREQIESEASMMTIEEAESLGIVDTTIRVVPPMNPDSVEALDNPILPLDTGVNP